MPPIDLKNYVIAVRFPEQPNINQGTAFLISQKDFGYVVTCYHVVRDHDSVDLYFAPANKKIRAELIPEYSRQDMDIAILKLLEEPPERFQILEFSLEQYNDRDFKSIGFSQGSKGLGIEGKIIRLIQPFEELPRALHEGLYQLGTKDVEEGVSGAPVVLADVGIAVGMIVVGNRTRENINDDLAFAQTIRAIQEVSGDLIPKQPIITNRQEWVSYMGFKVDPFKYVDGGEDPYLLEYFYRVPNFYDIYDITHLEPIFVFGPAGSGKSSLRNAISQMCYGDSIFAVIYHSFGYLADLVKKGDEQRAKPIDHIEKLIKAALEELFKRTEFIPDVEDKKVHRNYLWSFVTKYEADPVRRQKFYKILGPSRKRIESLPADPRELLGSFCRCVSELIGYSGVYFLVDPDENISSDIEIFWRGIESLISQPWLLELADYKITFKFFLNDNLFNRVLSIPWIKNRKGRNIYRPLNWSRDELLNMLKHRLRLSSIKNPPCVSLGELSDINDLDDQVIQRSQGSPRSLVDICSRMFSLHCQSPINDNRILITQDEVYEVFRQIDLDAPEPVAAQINSGEKSLDAFTLIDIIEQGENKWVEFKSSLRYDYETHKPEKYIEVAIAKTLCGFMNTEGGLLLIGIDDNGNVLGVDEDIKILTRSNEDGFIRAFTEILKVYLDLGLHQQIKNYGFLPYQRKKIFFIHAERSLEPIYCLLDQKHELFVRVGNATYKLDTKGAISYVQGHF